MPRSHSAAVGFFTRTGSRDEIDSIAGASHFLEHMMFKGTGKRSALDVNLAFDRMGAHYNAFTSEENTAYYAAVLPEYVPDVLELWADLLRPALRQEDFDIEKNVILEEIAMYKDSPHFDVLDRCRKLHFGQHNCGNSVLGSVESITALTRQQMQDYFDSRYSPDNMVLVAVGNINWEEFVQQAQQLCGHWQPKNPQRILSDFPGTGRTEIIKDENVQCEHICLMSPAPSAQSPQRYAANLLATIIGDDSNGRLYWQLVDNAMADSAEMEYDPMDGTGAYYCYISCQSENAGKVLAIAKETIAAVQTKGITEDELQMAKNKIASAMTLSGEMPMGRFVPLGFDWLYRKQYRSLNQSLENLLAVTAQDINQLLQQYNFQTMTVQAISPQK